RRGFVEKSITEGNNISGNVRHNVSLISEIVVYTYTEEVPLGTVYQKMYEKEVGKPAIDHKASKKDLESYFAEVLPDYDVERVYQSDIKKIIQWYNLLVTNGFTDFSKEEKETDKSEEKAVEEQNDEAAVKPKKTARKKKDEEE